MKYIVAGCGRVGAKVAEFLDEQGALVTVIDLNLNSFNRLPKNFKGVKVVGSCYNKQVLINAGVEQADGFIAVTNGDNTNIISSRIVKMEFGLENVIARIYDPKRADLYKRLGIRVVPVSLQGAKQIIEQVLPKNDHIQYRSINGDVVLASLKYNHAWVGLSFGEIQSLIKTRIAYITRNSSVFFPKHSSLLQDGDELTIILMANFLNECKLILSKEPQKD